MKNHVFSKNLSIAMLANAVGMLVAGVVTVVAPKLLSESDYGYWQLFAFYLTYIGFFHFGLQDGIYLRYGGQEYDKLPKSRLRSQLIALMMVELIVAAGLSAYAVLGTGNDTGRREVLLLFAGCCVLYLPSLLLQYILQLSNRIREYAICLMCEKIGYAVAVAVVFVTGGRSFGLVIAADLLGKGIGLVYGLSRCRDLAVAPRISWKEMWAEVGRNVRVGIFVLLSNLAGMFIIGIVRFFMEARYDIVTFGHISLSITLCNMILTFLVAMGQVLFPTLKRLGEKELPHYYERLDLGVTLLVGAALVVYQPVLALVARWLPGYAGSIHYLGLLFPLCLFEGKTNMLLNTYFKVLRREKALFVVNVIALVASAAIGAVTVLVWGNLELAMIGIVVSCGLRCLLCEILLRRQLQVRNVTSLVIEGVVAVSFLALNYYTTGWLALGLYAGVVIAILAVGVLQLRRMKS